MVAFHQKLSSKIIGILIVFFVVAITAIGMTLLISWQLEGGAAAINDAGSERFRSYRLAYLLQQTVQAGTGQAVLHETIRHEIGAFEATLTGLERGDPARPLFLPKEERIQAKMREIDRQWRQHMKPLILEVLASEDPGRKARLMASYQPLLVRFVALVNELVLLAEQDSWRKTTLLRSFQVGLVGLALVGTTLLIYFFVVMVIRPVAGLRGGIRRMAEADFSVRLPVASRDEFGELAHGFNQMADRLENLYATLGERVREKTESLEEKNQELAMLYEITTFLNEPASLEELCHGFLRKVMGLLVAQGGVVRLTDPHAGQLHMIVHESVSQAFVKEESCLALGECLCGGAAVDGASAFWSKDQPLPRPMLYSCQGDGFGSALVIPIRFKKQVLGVFNLFYQQPRIAMPHEMRLLETLGQHLGGAIENQRLVSREKEMAVSEERNLLAQELHDSIAQGLAFLNIQVQLLQDSLKRADIGEALEGLAQIREGVQESYDDVRELLVHFRTRLQDANLESAIGSALEKFEGQTGIRTEFRQSGSGVPLAPETVIQVLHIIQEALSNVRKHARASRVWVERS